MAKIPIPHQINQISDNSGIISRAWYQFFTSIFTQFDSRITSVVESKNPFYLSDNARFREELKIIYFEINDNGTWKQVGKMEL